METNANKTFIFKTAPKPGWPLAIENFAIETRSFDFEADPPTGGFTMANLFFSLDPGLRLRMVSKGEPCYTTPFVEGQPIPETSIAKVLKTNCSVFETGSLIIGTTVMEEYSIVQAHEVSSFKAIENPLGLPLTAFLGPLGIPGLTAYSSLMEFGRMKRGQTLYVSAAAGGVGQVVGQLAKVHGLRVLGSVGSDEKVEMIETVLHFDAGFNYKKESPRDALRRLAPEGIDIYYDNTSGEALDGALVNMKHYGRIISCGCASQYTTTPTTRYRIENVLQMAGRRLTMSGFIVFDDDMMKYAGDHVEQVGRLLADSAMVSLEDPTVGLEHAGEAFLGVLSGKNVGKAILQVARTTRP